MSKLEKLKEHPSLVSLSVCVLLVSICVGGLMYPISNSSTDIAKADFAAHSYTITEASINDVAVKVYVDSTSGLIEEAQKIGASTIYYDWQAGIFFVTDTGNVIYQMYSIPSMSWFGLHPVIGICVLLIAFPAVVIIYRHSNHY